MNKICLKCGATSAVDSADELASCPRCGAIYSRVEAAAQRERKNAAGRVHARPEENAKEAAASARRVRRNGIVAVVLAGGAIFYSALPSADDPAWEPRSESLDAVAQHVPAAPPSAVEVKKAVRPEKVTAVCRPDDATCIGERELGKANGPCTRAVEARLAYRHEWKDSWYEEKFDRVGWYEPTSTLIYHGSKLEAQNGFGAWMKPTYFCVWNIGTGRVVKAGING